MMCGCCASAMSGWRCATQLRPQPKTSRVNVDDAQAEETNRKTGDEVTVVCRRDQRRFPRRVQTSRKRTAAGKSRQGDCPTPPAGVAREPRTPRRGSHPLTAANHAGRLAGQQNWRGAPLSDGSNLRLANPHGALVGRGFLGDAPAQVTRLEPATVFLAVLAQAWEYVFLKRIPLSLEIAEVRADENTKCQFTPVHIYASSFCLLLSLGGAVNAANGRHCCIAGAFVGGDRVGFLKQNPDLPTAHHQRFLAATEIKREAEALRVKCCPSSSKAATLRISCRASTGSSQARGPS